MDTRALFKFTSGLYVVSASDGTRFGFNFANMEFLENCLKLADHRYPWYYWRRYGARATAHILYDAVRGDGGWKAWIDNNTINYEKDVQ